MPTAALIRSKTMTIEKFSHAFFGLERKNRDAIEFLGVIERTTSAGAEIGGSHRSQREVL